MTPPRYAFYKAPEGFHSQGAGVTILPGFGPWVLIAGHIKDIPEGAVPVADVVRFLEGVKQ